MIRVANLIDRIGYKLDDIHVTLDSHYAMDGRHPEFWTNSSGTNPIPTNLGGGLISSTDIESGKWRPIGGNSKPKVLGGMSVTEFMIKCAKHRESEGVPGLEIWSPHCLIGSTGQSVQSDLYNSLLKWERTYKATINYVVKGTNVFTEHYGALCSNDPIPADPSTGLNTRFIQALDTFGVIYLAGEAASHCVLTTVTQVADNIGDISKLVLLTDCTSPIPAVPGADFPAIYEAWKSGMVARGMKCAKSTDI
jgi:nicotinamidase-related amidase